MMMTNRLVIHFPNSKLVFDSDKTDKLAALSSFCQKELGAYHATEDINELTVDELNEEMSNDLYSKIFQLDLL